MRFTVLRPSQRLASPCSHRPPGGDVSGRVHVGVGCVPAGLAFEHRLALAVVSCDVSAARTPKRRVRRVDLLQPSRPLLLQASDQTAPAGRQDRAIEPGLGSYVRSRLVDRTACGASHRANPQVLDPDQIERPHQRGRGLLDPVFPPGHVAGLQFRNRPLHALPSRGPSNASSQSPLEDHELTTLARREATTVQQFTGRQSGRDDHAAVHTHNLAVSGGGDGIGHNREGDMPTAGAVVRDPIGASSGRHTPRPHEAHPSDLRHPQLAGSAVEPTDMTRLESDLTEAFAVACLAPTRSSAPAAPGVYHRLCKVSQRLLLDGDAAESKPIEIATRFGQLPSLLDIARRRGAARPPMRVLLHRKVPDEPCVTAMGQQRCLLPLVWRQSVTSHVEMVTGHSDKIRRRALVPQWSTE